MKNIVIKHSIRGIEPDLGILPDDSIIIDLNAELSERFNNSNVLSDKTLRMDNTLPIILNRFQENKIDLNEDFILYCIAPNSFLVGISYYLTLMGFKFSFYPKPNGQQLWGYQDGSPLKPDRMQYVPKGSAFDKKMFKDEKVGVILNGAYDIPVENRVLIGDGHIDLSTKYTGINANKTTIFSKYGFDDEGFATLVTKESCTELLKGLMQILDSINEYDLKEVHILSSLPANGLLLLGKALTTHKICKKIKVFVYNYNTNERYELGDILSYNLLNKVKGECSE